MLFTYAIILGNKKIKLKLFHFNISKKENVGAEIKLYSSICE
jgi:hypothetical protein